MTEHERRVADMELSRAKAKQNAAEFERDVSAGIAANDAAARGIAVADAVEARIDASKSAAAVQDILDQRDSVIGLAVNEAAHRKTAEAAAVDSRMVANHNAAATQEMATERNLLREELTAERHASSSNAFGFYLITALILAFMLVGGVYYYLHRQDAIKAAQQGTTVTFNSTRAGR